MAAQVDKISRLFLLPPHAPMQRQQEALELPHANARLRDLRRLTAPPQMQESRPSLVDSKRAWPVAKARQPERQVNSVGPWSGVPAGCVRVSCQCGSVIVSVILNIKSVYRCADLPSLNTIPNSNPGPGPVRNEIDSPSPVGNQHDRQAPKTTPINAMSLAGSTLRLGRSAARGATD